MSVVEVDVHYRYTYPEPITQLRHRLLVVPPVRHARQRLLEHRLEVECDGVPVTVHEEQDAFGNRVHRLLAPRVEQAIDFHARYVVVHQGRSVRASGDVGRYLCPTSLTTPDARITQAARDIQATAGVGASEYELAERGYEWAAAALVWQLGVTTYQTPAALALRLGKGVCQDYAHLLLAVLRLLRIPARYVSGHLLGSGPPHAWVEALLEDGRRVVGFDPSHRRQTGPEYLTVAVGGDFSDVTPTSGVFSGARQDSVLSYNKSTRASDPSGVEVKSENPAA